MYTYIYIYLIISLNLLSQNFVGNQQAEGIPGSLQEFQVYVCEAINF